MASSSVDIATGAESSAAQKLLQKHAEVPHHVTVEDAVDEDLPLPPTQGTSTAQPAQVNSRKAPLDTQSHEVFPELGAPKGKATNVPPVWGAKPGANGKANGSSPEAGSRSSTPASTATAPVQTAQAPKPSMSIPGRNVESVTIEPQYVLPRGQLKRPILDTIKDINRKSRANVSMSTASGGRLKFDATGPQEIAQQALKDLIQQIGTKVCLLAFVYLFGCELLTSGRLLSKCRFPSQPVRTSLGRVAQ